MMANVMRVCRIGAVVNIAIAVGNAHTGVIGIRLSVTKRHPNPERWIELKIKSSSRAILERGSGRIGGQNDQVNAGVARSRRAGIENQRRLIVTGIPPSGDIALPKLGTEAGV